MLRPVAVVCAAEREAGVAAVRVDTDDAVRAVALFDAREEPSAVRVCAAEREEAAVREAAEACAREDEALEVRILLLPKDREEVLMAAALRDEAPVRPAATLPPAEAVRAAERRSTSKERALVKPRLALRVANERSGWRTA